ncbi:MAG: GNAT family N-acetyltransferase [Rhodospirillaceae bacterium]|nr:GNAT family N-acetyltransferase [Magnetovibrio sp.]MAY66301.1 GNAT family N-acetyltransferase [Rhodospirillaceae bacterium]|tara:strand:+ start:166 stop:759 length:594 start_codon:yes stop_codon:yes gene_type:complete
MTEMSVTQILFRDAEQDDAREIAALYRLAAGGVADVIWDALKEPGEDIVDAGARRYAREGADFSYQNCAIAECRGRPVGLLHAYPMQSDPDFDPASLDPVLRPYAALEEEDSYYIAGIALKPDFRGRGMGTKMLRLAELRAFTRGLNKLSLIAFEENTASIRLYERLGYKEADSRDVVPHPFIQYDGRALLMVKTLA